MVFVDIANAANVHIFDSLYPPICLWFASRGYTTLVDGSDGQLGRLQESWYRLVFIPLAFSKKYLYVLLPDIDDCALCEFSV